MNSEKRQGTEESAKRFAYELVSPHQSSDGPKNITTGNGNNTSASLLVRSKCGTLEGRESTDLPANADTRVKTAKPSTGIMFQKDNESSPWSLTDWLAARQDFGLHRHAALRARYGRISPERMGFVSAWNPSRMRNMTLAVGPGTPASVLWQTGADRDDDDDDDTMNDEEEEEDSSMSEEDEGGHTGEEGMGEGEDSSDHEGQDNDEEEDANPPGDISDDNSVGQSMEVDENDPAILQAQAMMREFMRANMAPDSDESSIEEEEEEERDHGWARSKERFPSLRHGGCINTACWLDCPWQLAAANNSHASSSMFGPSCTRTVSSLEYPTQIITSGDDRLIKVWDVKDAMGMTNPLEGGWDTFLPLADADRPDSTTLRRSWKSYYRRRPHSRMAGSVVHLATLASGHRGNVFHALPVEDQPGKILTCGADGGLRLSDLQSEVSSVVASVGERSNFLFSSTMAFSFVFLNRSTGLLCSEEGLHRFDLRVPPRDQERRSLLDGLNGRLGSDPLDYCKSCAVWSPHTGTQETSRDSSWMMESNYVFAGGRSELVGLLDLRTSGGSSRLVQSYTPRALKETRNVSVSGLDVSKDGKELLVSYESDQIYSFPILHSCSSSAGPTLDEIDCLCKNSDEPVRELASYGGHLNRYTFLKNAKFAGPNDDYICTGSDSGCGWIYERRSGNAVSLLGADKCTCNGVIPHPSLPFFISYGIDSTAKLWRASPPVSCAADDSPSGRAKCAVEQEYEISPVTKNWSTVQKFVERDVSPGMLPDFVASPSEMTTGYRFSPRESRAICGDASPKFGNALRLLPSILRRNRHQCYRLTQRYIDSSVHGGGGDLPVEQDVAEFTHRVAMSRLRMQADSLGLRWDLAKPWAFGPLPDTLLQSPVVHRADMVPDHPSDWLLYDPSMTGAPYEPKNFNYGEFGALLKERFAREEGRLPSLVGVDAGNDSQAMDDEDYDSKELAGQQPPWLQNCDLVDEDIVLRNKWLYQLSDSTVEEEQFVRRSRQFFYATILLLKEGGNQAMKDGLFRTAARRYDKAIQYCAIAFMKHEESEERLRHLACVNPSATAKNRDGEESTSSEDPIAWTPLIQLLVSTRLNMALWFLRPEHAEPKLAMEQARAALAFLRPFTVGDAKKDSAILTLQAKAHYRLGSAKLELGNYSEAVECFEASLQDNQQANLRGGKGSKPDALVVKRLQEAKRKLQTKKKREKKRYEQAFRRMGTNDTK